MDDDRRRRRATLDDDQRGGRRGRRSRCSASRFTISRQVGCSVKVNYATARGSADGRRGLRPRERDSRVGRRAMTKTSPSNPTIGDARSTRTTRRSQSTSPVRPRRSATEPRRRRSPTTTQRPSERSATSPSSREHRNRRRVDHRDTLGCEREDGTILRAADSPGTATAGRLRCEVGPSSSRRATRGSIVVKVEGDTLFEPDETVLRRLTDPDQRGQDRHARRGHDRRRRLARRRLSRPSPSVVEGNSGLTDLVFQATPRVSAADVQLPDGGGHGQRLRLTRGGRRPARSQSADAGPATTRCPSRSR